jgi:hypothetical protein
VRLGEHTKSTTRDCVVNEITNEELYCADPIQDINIVPADFIPHEDYNPSSFKNDIALIRLPILAKTNQNNIKTICLPFDPKPMTRIMTVIGFGRTENNNENSDILRKVNVKLRSNEDCSNINGLKKWQRLNNKQICAGGKTKFLNK